MTTTAVPESVVQFSELYSAAYAVNSALFAHGHTGGKVFGIPRGGVSAALLFSVATSGRWAMTDDPLQASLIIDDLYDSGATMRQYRERYPGIHLAVLITKDAAGASTDGIFFGTVSPHGLWLSFPWERASLSGPDQSSSDIFTRLLQFIGEDPAREGLKETPARASKAWREWSSGYQFDPAEVMKTFEDGAQNYDEMVLVKNIPVYSHCEHHLAPFFGVAHVGYVPRTRIVGLSKISRLVDIFSKRLQVQERLTVQIADAMEEHLKPQGVGVMIQCRHLCMESRGIARSNVATVTTALRGCFRDPKAKSEFLKTISSN